MDAHGSLVKRHIKKNIFKENVEEKKGFDEAVQSIVGRLNNTEFFRTCLLFTTGAFSFFLISAAAIFLIEGPINSKFYSLPSPPLLEGSLRKNNLLTQARRQLENYVIGPESFASHQSFQTTYTGIKTGHIIEIKNNGSNALKVQRAFHLRYGTGQNNCTGSYGTAVRCGRPLGLRFRKKKEDLLLIADAYYGLYQFNVVTADYEIILKPGTQITGYPDAIPLRFLNDLDEMEDGTTVILSEPSTKFSDRDCLYAMAEHGGDGRLLSYNFLTGELKILLNDLHYPNGVQVEPGGRCVLIAEMGKARILSVVIDNLPGYPDNIRLSASGNLWVPLGGVRLEDDNWISQRPFLRDTLAKLTTATLFQWITELIVPKYGLILLVDLHSGEILKSLHDPSGSNIPSISQVEELRDGTLLLGSDSNTFIGMLPPNWGEN